MFTFTVTTPDNSLTFEQTHASHESATNQRTKLLAASFTCGPIKADASPPTPEWQPSYSRWRHGGWYVHNVRYPSGAIGCVSNNYPDKKWRIVCDPRPFDEAPTFRSRDDAARAERELVKQIASQSHA